MEQRLLNYSDNPVAWDPSANQDSITVYGADITKSVRFGVGLAYFYYSYVNPNYPHWHGAFGLFEDSPVEYSSRSYGSTSVLLTKALEYSASGLITTTGEGFLCAPSVRLSGSSGEVAVMLLTSRKTSPMMVSSDKHSLTIPSYEVDLSLSMGGQLVCIGSILKDGFKSAKLVLRRAPRLPVYSRSYEQTLFETKQAGTVNAKWTPVAPSFEDCVVALNPLKMSANSRFSVDGIAEILGAPDIFPRTSDFVIGDGGPVDYMLRLVVEHHLGVHNSDDAKLTIA